MIQKPKGTKDLLPGESFIWKKVERIIERILRDYNFKEIRVPVFEHTELFQRGVGETTDVVQKEMYTFNDKGGRSISLRPEGTAGVVRAYLENGMASKPSPVKLWYNMAMYRYENVQKGRLREFHQIGAEIIGGESYLSDVEAILMANHIFKALEIPNVELNINSIGCPNCRANYQQKLKEFIGINLEQYCDVCKTRFEKNPMRILDCKEHRCKELNQGAPRMIDYLCDECKEHFENVKEMLDSQNIKYEIDSGIVRGLDYYTKTVFEFVDKTSGLTVLGGGRYDGLIEEFGGVHTPAVGFAAGMERLMELYMENHQNLEERKPDLYILTASKRASKKGLEVAQYLRERGFYVETDIIERSFNAQMKYANKLGLNLVLIIGEYELANNQAIIRNMEFGEEFRLKLEYDMEMLMDLIHSTEDM